MMALLGLCASVSRPVIASLQVAASGNRKALVYRPGQMIQLLSRLPRAFAESVQFLSRLPLWRVLSLESKPDFAMTAHAFPLAGLLLGALAWLPAAAMLAVGAPPSLGAVVFVATGTLLTGALHEDGLADVADGFWGGADRERKLAIMRDSTVGTYGVLALIGIVSLRLVVWAALFATLPLATTLAIAAAAASLSRFAMLLPWIYLAPARTPAASGTRNGKEVSGLSVRYGTPERQTLLAAAVLALPAVALLGSAAPVALLGATVGTLAMAGLAHLHIAGQTGDVLGATQQLSEAGLLTALVLAIGAA